MPSSGGHELTDGKEIVLIDAGSGSSFNYEKTAAKLNDLEAIAFTHFHVDHSSDFSAYVKGSYFTHRIQDLNVFGAEANQLMPSATEFTDRLFGNKGAFPYLKDYVSTEKKSNFTIRAKDIKLDKHKKQTAYQSKDYALFAIPVHHGPIPALAW